MWNSTVRGWSWGSDELRRYLSAWSNPRYSLFVFFDQRDIHKDRGGCPCPEELPPWIITSIMNRNEALQCSQRMECHLGGDRPPVKGSLRSTGGDLPCPRSSIGSQKLEELARPGMEVALLFDDLQRPTPVHLALPEILNRLNAPHPRWADTGICAVGTHPFPHGNNLKKRSEGDLQPSGRPSRLPMTPIPLTTSSSAEPTAERSWRSTLLAFSDLIVVWENACLTPSPALEALQDSSARSLFLSFRRGPSL